MKNQGKDSPASIKRRRCSSGSSGRPERCQWSPLRKKDEDKKVYMRKKVPCALRHPAPPVSEWRILDIDFDVEYSIF